MPEIIFASEDQIEVPHEFVMICNASGVPNTNLVPIFHLGKHRIRALAINCGVLDPDNRTVQETQNAYAPAMWLANFARTQLGIPAANVRLFNGDPDGVTDWAAADGGAVGWAAQFGLPVLANFQGGTTQMSLGLELALSASDVDWMRLFLGKAPPLPYLAVRVADSMADVVLPQPQENVPLDVLLDARGYHRIDEERQQARQAFMQDHAHVAGQMLAGFLRLHGQPARRYQAALLRATFNQLLADPRQARYPMPLHHRDLTQIEALYRPLVGADLWNDGVIRDDAHRHFLQAGWFEQAMADRLRQAISARAGWQIHANVAIQRNNGQGTANEIDLLLMQHELCHLVELKSGRDPADLQEWGDKLVKLNRLLAGRPGRCWIVAPFMWIDDPARREEAVNRLAATGVRLLMGFDAVEHLKADLRDLAEG